MTAAAIVWLLIVTGRDLPMPAYVYAQEDLCLQDAQRLGDDDASLEFTCVQVEVK